MAIAAREGRKNFFSVKKDLNPPVGTGTKTKLRRFLQFEFVEDYAFVTAVAFFPGHGIQINAVILTQGKFFALYRNPQQIFRRGTGIETPCFRQERLSRPHVFICSVADFRFISKIKQYGIRLPELILEFSVFDPELLSGEKFHY